MSNATDNGRFQIERSTDGLIFSAIGMLPQLKGATATNGNSVYYYSDNSPNTGNNFYRIRQIDQDGNNTLSIILEFSTGRSLSGIHLRINPVADEATLVNSSQLKLLRLKIADLSGRVLIDRALQSSSSTITISLPGLVPGYYLMNLTTENRPTTLRFVKL